jgi:hypothetical protein
MIDHGESFGNTVNDLLKKNRDVLKLYKSYNDFYKKIVHSSNFAVDFGLGNLMNNKEIMHMEIYDYLLLSEGLFSKFIDMICFFFIKKGDKVEHRLIYNKKNINEFHELKYVNVITKLKFLQDNDFNLFMKYFKTDLRNAIAHVDFIIDEYGNLVYDKKKFTYDEMHKINSNFLDLIKSIQESLSRSYKKYMKSLSEYSKTNESLK